MICSLSLLSPWPLQKGIDPMGYATKVMYMCESMTALARSGQIIFFMLPLYVLDVGGYLTIFPF